MARKKHETDFVSLSADWCEKLLQAKPFFIHNRRINMFPLLVAWILLIDVLVQAAPTRPPTRSPTRSPTRFPTRSPTRAPTRTRSPTGSRSPTTAVNTVKGWVYLTSYADSSCSSMKNATGTPIETCLFDQSTSTYFQYTCVSGKFSTPNP